MALFNDDTLIPELGLTEAEYVALISLLNEAADALNELHDAYADWNADEQGFEEPDDPDYVPSWKKVYRRDLPTLVDDTETDDLTACVNELSKGLEHVRTVRKSVADLAHAIASDPGSLRGENPDSSTKVLSELRYLTLRSLNSWGKWTSPEFQKLIQFLAKHTEDAPVIDFVEGKKVRAISALDDGISDCIAFHPDSTAVSFEHPFVGRLDGTLAVAGLIQALQVAIEMVPAGLTDLGRFSLLSDPDEVERLSKVAPTKVQLFQCQAKANRLKRRLNPYRLRIHAAATDN